MAIPNDRFAFLKLFEVVGERLTRDYTEKTGWMYSHQWTTAQRDEYTQWLAAELAARKLYENEKESQIAAMFFVHKNGWQINNFPRSKAA
jgi:chitinase